MRSDTSNKRKQQRSKLYDQYGRGLSKPCRLALESFRLVRGQPGSPG